MSASTMKLLQSWCHLHLSFDWLLEQFYLELKINSWISMEICGILIIVSIILIKTLAFSSNEIQTRAHRISRSLIRISVYYCCRFEKSNHATSLNRFEDLIQECQTHLGNFLIFSSTNRDSKPNLFLFSL